MVVDGSYAAEDSFILVVNGSYAAEDSLGSTGSNAASTASQKMLRKDLFLLLHADSIWCAVDPVTVFAVYLSSALFEFLGQMYIHFSFKISSIISSFSSTPLSFLLSSDIPPELGSSNSPTPTLSF